MKIRRFVVKLACYDNNPTTEKQLEDAIEHGMPEGSNSAASAQLIDERTVDYPDIDHSLTAHSFDAAVAAWDQVAEEEIYK